MTADVCNAVLGDESRCDRPSGYMTSHPGEGKCYSHGGLKPPASDDFRNALEIHGLGGVIEVAESMTRDEAEYVAHVSSAALLTIRAKYIAMLLDPERTPKEAADLSLALRRVESSIEALDSGTKLGTLSDQEAVEATERAEAEESRLKGLAEKYG